MVHQLYCFWRRRVTVFTLSLFLPSPLVFVFDESVARATITPRSLPFPTVIFCFLLVARRPALLLCSLYIVQQIQYHKQLWRRKVGAETVNNNGARRRRHHFSLQRRVELPAISSMHAFIDQSTAFPTEPSAIARPWNM